MRDNKKLIFIVWALAFLAPLPGVVSYLAGLWDLDQYGYMLPLFAAIAGFAFFRWDSELRLPRLIGAIALGLGLLASLLGAHQNSPLLSMIGFSLVGTAWLDSHLQTNSIRQRMTYIAVLFLIAIRLPLNYDIELTALLQRITSRISSHVLDAIGILNHLRGNVIEISSGTLFVEEACSGVQSLFTILFLALLMVVYSQRSVVAVPIYLLAGIFWAMVMNIARITSIAVFQEWYAIDLSKGTPHEILGWICLAAATLMLASTDRILRFFFHPIGADGTKQTNRNPLARAWDLTVAVGLNPDNKEDDGKQSIVQAASEPVKRPQLLWSCIPLLIASLISGIPSIGFGARSLMKNLGQDELAISKDILWKPNKDMMSDSDWKANILSHHRRRGEYSKQLGSNSDIWTVAIDGIELRVAISQPYPEWHDMCLCYTGNGWRENDFVVDTDGGSEWSLSRAEFVSDTGDFGYVLFSGLYKNGDPITAPSGVMSMFRERRKNRDNLNFDVIMLQIWAKTQTPLLPEQLAKIEKFFRDFRRAAKRDLLASLQK